MKEPAAARDSKFEAIAYGHTHKWRVERPGALGPRDEHGNDADGICMNCGAAVVENPMHPWCAECDADDDAAFRDELRRVGQSWYDFWYAEGLAGRPYTGRTFIGYYGWCDGRDDRG